MWATIQRWLPYLSFYWQHRARINAWIDEGKRILAIFRQKYPDALQPTETDVVDALAKSTGGKTSWTPKKVRDWTPQEWENFWNRHPTG